MYHSGVIYLKLQFEVLVLGNKTQVLRDLSGPSPLVNLYFKTKSTDGTLNVLYQKQKPGRERSLPVH